MATTTTESRSPNRKLPISLVSLKFPDKKHMKFSRYNLTLQLLLLRLSCHFFGGSERTGMRGVDGLKCACNDYSCSEDSTCSADSYCQKRWIVAGGAIKDQTCVTTRSDLSEVRCQTNRKGIVSCLCDTDMCNDDSFAIPDDVTLTMPPVVKCHRETDSEDDFCFGHACLYRSVFVMNDFGDLIPSTVDDVRRGCDDSEYNHDLDSLNMCYQTDDVISCKCNSEFCNRAQPFPVPIGRILCYFDDSTNVDGPYSLKYCLGQMCYAHEPFADNARTRRGCLSVSESAPDEVKTGGSLYCMQHLCNGDYQANRTTTP